MNAPVRLVARWPAIMKRRTAAEYLDMSIPSFEKEIAAGRLPSGVIVGGCQHWHKEALDKALARIAGDLETGDDDILRDIEEGLKRYG